MGVLSDVDGKIQSLRQNFTHQLILVSESGWVRVWSLDPFTPSSPLMSRFRLFGQTRPLVYLRCPHASSSPPSSSSPSVQSALNSGDADV